MNDASISVKNLGKYYQLGGSPGDYSTIRDEYRKWIEFISSLGRERRSSQNHLFWALKNISFEVMKGEVIGIIGRNGAGKSTLLKILSRITEPSEGEADIHGQVGSLLEVGTGFHPELTGRENVYLNGAIMGMRRSEIIRKFDEIVEFAEMSKFIDTPVKHYSSGMYTRLAFAVAAHLEPEVLIVDEVLAVGDTAFQKKCMGKMGEIAGLGRTVLFVSHNISAVRSLCSRTIVLQAGQVAFDGRTSEAIKIYLDRPEELQPEWHDTRTGLETPRGEVRFLGVRIRLINGLISGTVSPIETFYIEIDYEVKKRTSCQIAFRVNQDDGETVFTTGDGDLKSTICRSRQPGRYQARVRIPEHLLPPGRYHLLLAANRYNEKAHDLLEKVLHFEVDSIGSLRDMDGRWGAVVPLLEWIETDEFGNAKPNGDF